MGNEIIERILRESNGKPIMDFLTQEISPTDLQSLMLAIYKRRVSRMSPHDVLRQYMENRFVKPSPIEPKLLVAFNQLAFSLLSEEFKGIDLSPLAPIGTSSLLGPVSQNKVVTSVRNTELVADSTNVLALECARQRREQMKLKPKGDGVLKLSTAQRQVRAQMFDSPHSFAHFMLFALCTAGRDRGSFQFHLDALTEHIDFYIRLLAELESIKMPVSGIRLVLFILNPRIGDSVRLDLCKTIEDRYPDVIIDIDPDGDRGDGYYQDIRYNIFATNKQGSEYFLADGGFTDWTQKLMQNRKERLLTSGIGSERICDCFS